ncbi:MAG: hypothetical protein J7L23_00830 [Candidatus Diapherotrites archaeon]|nr:hypothetical protein [Candidatus Diapherotrites archaeon]
MKKLAFLLAIFLVATSYAAVLKGNTSEYNWVKVGYKQYNWNWKCTRAPYNIQAYVPPVNMIQTNEPSFSFSFKVDNSTPEVYATSAKFGLLGRNGKEVFMQYSWDTDSVSENGIRAGFYDGAGNRYKTRYTAYEEIETGRTYDIRVWISKGVGCISIDGEVENVSLESDFTDYYGGFRFWLGGGTDHWDTFSNAQGSCKGIHSMGKPLYIDRVEYSIVNDSYDTYSSSSWSEEDYSNSGWYPEKPMPNDVTTNNDWLSGIWVYVLVIGILFSLAFLVLIIVIIIIILKNRSTKSERRIK